MEWIKIENGFPQMIHHNGETSEKVLVFFDNKFVSIGYMYKKYGNRKNVWFTNDDTHDSEEINPTHWMRLPQPPVR